MADNNNTSDRDILFAIFTVLSFVVVVVLYFAAVFGSILVTIWALSAWNRSRTIWGYTLYPDEARLFVMRGLAGAVLLPVLAFLIVWWFDGVIPSNVWAYLIAGGYALGSLGIMALEQEVRAAEPQAFPMPDPAPVPAPARLPVVPVRDEEHAAPAPKPAFQFASWDDEKEFKP